jgi:hypothetical protein
MLLRTRCPASDYRSGAICVAARVKMAVPVLICIKAFPVPTSQFAGMKRATNSTGHPAPSPAYAVLLGLIAMVVAAAVLLIPAPATPTSEPPVATVSAPAHDNAAAGDCRVPAGSPGHCQVPLATTERGGLAGAAPTRLRDERWNVRGESHRAQYLPGGRFRPPDSAALA